MRPLTRNDAKKLGLVATEFSECWNERMIVSAFDGGRFYGFIEENPFGFITFSIGLDVADIESLFVSSSYRRKGLATKLLTLAIEKIKDEGISAVLLEVKDINIPAQKLYEKFGFEKISVRKKYYSDGDAYVYKKELLK